MSKSVKSETDTLNFLCQQQKMLWRLPFNGLWFWISRYRQHLILYLPGADLGRTEAFRLRGRLCGALRREGIESRSVRSGSVRVAPLQAGGRSGRPSCLLRSPQIHHGVQRSGMRGNRIDEDICILPLIALQVVVSGKLRGQRAKAMKFVDGLMIHSGNPVNDYIQTAVRHVQLRQGKLYFKSFIIGLYE